MIIQCRQCRTKFRFDDALMEGDGVWLRCSHCQHVFFQDNPQAAKPGMEFMANDERTGAADAGTGRSEEVTPARAASVTGADEDVADFLEDVLKTQKNGKKESILEIEKPVNEEITADENALTDESAEGGEADRPDKRKSPAKGWRKAVKVLLWAILVIIVLPAIIYYFVFPEIGDRLIKIANQYFDIGIQESASPEVVTGQVKLQDIRQRILSNYVLGPIRIVEGTAVNQADYPISRIVIKGEIVDAYAVMLGERASYAGNVLTDEELTTLPEAEILKKLSQPEGRGNSNDKIVPNGQIPFMIVFAREPVGVIKTTVTTIGAERLLTN